MYIHLWKRDNLLLLWASGYSLKDADFQVPCFTGFLGLFAQGYSPVLFQDGYTRFPVSFPLRIHAALFLRG